MNDPIRKKHDEMIAAATDAGKLLEAGFIALHAQVLPDWSPEAVDCAQRIYMAGAQHLYASMMSVLSAGGEIKPSDLRRMALIDAELRAFEPRLNEMAAGPRKGPTQ